MLPSRGGYPDASLSRGGLGHREQLRAPELAQQPQASERPPWGGGVHQPLSSCRRGPGWLAACLSVGLPAYVTQLPCQPASLPAQLLDLWLPVRTEQATGESAGAQHASPQSSQGGRLQHTEDAFLCREALRALPSWGQRAPYSRPQKPWALRPRRLCRAGAGGKVPRCQDARGPGSGAAHSVRRWPVPEALPGSAG